MRKNSYFTFRNVGQILCIVFTLTGSSTGFGARGSCTDLEIVTSGIGRSVSAFEADGGTGIWFSAAIPQRLGGGTGVFYAVTKLPAKVNQNSPIFMLRTAESRGALQDSINLGAPIVFGKISALSQVQAAAIGSAEISVEALRVTNSDKKNIILIQPDTAVFTLAHELRHWLDFENTNFLKGLNRDLTDLVTGLQMDSKWVPLLEQITIEIRGHIVQAKQARLSLSINAPYIDRAGNIITGKDLAREYAFEERQATQVFNQAYQSALFAFTEQLNPGQVKKVVKVLSKYDSSELPDNKLTFARILNVNIDQ